MESNISAVFQIVVKSGQMFYKNKLLGFTAEKFETFVETLPDEWWHPNDKIAYFTYYSDGSYFCEREKSFYDYSLKSEVTKIYEYNSLSNDSAKELFLRFCEFFEEARIEELKLKKELLRTQISEVFDVISIQYRRTRDMLLTDSDWITLPDVADLKTEEENTLWKQYRQFLRDMPQSDAWVNSEYYNIVFPIQPDRFLANFPGEEYLSSPSHFESPATLAIKEKLLAIFKDLKLASLDQRGSELSGSETDQSTISLLIDMVNEKLSEIDTDIKVEVNITSNNM